MTADLYVECDAGIAGGCGACEKCDPEWWAARRTSENARAYVVSKGGDPDCGACAEVAFCEMTSARHDCGQGGEVEIIPGPPASVLPCNICDPFGGGCDHEGEAGHRPKGDAQ